MNYNLEIFSNPLIILLLIWSLVWKGFALWRAAKNGHKVWYVVMLLVNTIGLIEIVYLLITELDKKKKKQ